MHVGHDAANVPEDAVVVVSSAIRETNPELAAARERGQQVIHRSQALALAAEGRDFVAVAGAHGKTGKAERRAERQQVQRASREEWSSRGDGLTWLFA